MYFRVTRAIADFAGRMGDEQVTYDLARPFITHVAIDKHPQTTELPKGAVIASCTTTRELDATQGLVDLTSAMAASKDGRSVNFEGMNEKVKAIYEIVDPIFRELNTQLQTSIMLLKWRCGMTDGPVESLSNRSEAVSSDGAVWRNISTLRSIGLIFGRPFLKIDPSIIEEISQMQNAGVELPLGIQLVMEARCQSKTHSRSALVIGVTAAEIALKQLIGELAPDARWLAQNVPSPPIHKIAKDYIPSLKVKARVMGKTVRMPKKLLKKLQEAVELRNRVVHAGEPAPRQEELRGILDAMEDVVWVCGLYAGHTWAWDHVSFDTQSTWEDDK